MVPVGALKMSWTKKGFCLAAMLLSAAPAWASEGGESPTLFTGDAGNIFWSLVTFLGVLLVLGKFAWKPILNGLQQREKFIRDSLSQAKHDREEAEKRLKDLTDRLNAARVEATALVDEGRRDADALRRKIESEAKAESDRMIERAKREIGIATDSAVKELCTLGSKLATDVASRIIRKELNAKEHERLISESIEQLGSAMAARRN